MADPLLKVRNVDELITSSYRFLMIAITNLNFLTFILFSTEQDKAIEYLACEIGQKLPVRTAPEKVTLEEQQGKFRWMWPSSTKSSDP